MSSAAQLVAEALECTDVEQMRARLLARLDESVPSDAIDLLPLSQTERARRWIERSEYMRRTVDYYHLCPESDFAKGARAAFESGGAFVDTDVYSLDDRMKLTLWAEVYRPLGLKSQLLALGTFRGQRTFVLCFQRYGRARSYDAHHRDRVVELLPTIALIESAFSAKSALTSQLSEREGQVANLVACGLRNREVATCLGTSVNTVRKQLVSIFEKVGVDNRTTLVAKLAGDDLAECEPTLVEVLRRCRARKPQGDHLAT